MNTSKTQPPAAGQAAHTPTPWHVSHNGNNDTRIFDAGSLITSPKCIANVPVYLGRTLECDANAAFIVRACNSHAALVAALETLRSVYAEKPPAMSDNEKHTAYVLRIIAAEERADAALAQAKETQS